MKKHISVFVALGAFFISGFARADVAATSFRDLARTFNESANVKTVIDKMKPGLQPDQYAFLSAKALQAGKTKVTAVAETDRELSLSADGMTVVIRLNPKEPGIISVNNKKLNFLDVTDMQERYNLVVQALPDRSSMMPLPWSVLLPAAHAAAAALPVAATASSTAANNDTACKQQDEYILQCREAMRKTLQGLKRANPKEDVKQLEEDLDKIVQTKGQHKATPEAPMAGLVRKATTKCESKFDEENDIWNADLFQKILQTGGAGKGCLDFKKLTCPPDTATCYTKDSSDDQDRTGTLGSCMRELYVASKKLCLNEATKRYEKLQGPGAGPSDNSGATGQRQDPGKK